MLLTIIVIFIIALLIIAQWAERASGKSGPYPYVQHEALFTPAERRFLSVLEQSVGAEYRVMGKVRLADIIAVDERLAGDRARAARGKINQKYVDFALCASDILAVVLVVELDDRSHERADRKVRDAFVDGALAAAGVPIVHVPVQSHYSVADIQRRIAEALKG